MPRVSSGERVQDRLGGVPGVLGDLIVVAASASSLAAQPGARFAAWCVRGGMA